MKRMPVNKANSAKQFNQKSRRTKSLNTQPTPMRGGFRL